MDRTKRREERTRTRPESSIVGVYHSRGSPPVISASLSASVPVQQERTIATPLPVASRLICRRTASLEIRQDGDTANAKKDALAIPPPPLRRYSDDSIPSNLIHSSSRLTHSEHRNSPPTTSCIRRKLKSNEESIHLLPLTCGGMTGSHFTGTGDSNGQLSRSHLKGWQQLEQERPRFRLTPLETKQYCHTGQGGSRKYGQQAGTGGQTSSSSSESNTTVLQLPKLWDPTARKLSKSVMDFKKYCGCSENICALNSKLDDLLHN
ncbi:uncharacterized protein LOC134184639 [Corticium candelabrum]|uniref:uncharacterized protein LOC134184639 n=1 Tax=Corticium candelabrum TaxID=121492 RepID=UPI002E37F93B|nr:uncharacterized protein LOC134184639 [Corticium candelabrum]